MFRRGVDRASARGSQRPPLLQQTFGSFPTSTASGWTAGVVAWIAAGTWIGDRWADDSTARFIRDGAVRWPAALLVLLVLLAIRSKLPVDLVGRPQAPTWFPWATILLAVVALVRVSVVSQFWDDAGYTAATFFSELSTGVLEELAFRGLIFCGLIAGMGRSRLGVGRAAIISTLLFGVAHVLGGWGAVVVTTAFGALFLMCALELRSLWPAAILHGLFDVGVNGAGPAGQGSWNETAMSTASLAMVLGGLVALGMFVFWRSWPVVDAALK